MGIRTPVLTTDVLQLPLNLRILSDRLHKAFSNIKFIGVSIIFLFFKDNIEWIISCDTYLSVWILLLIWHGKGQKSGDTADFLSKADAH